MHINMTVMRINMTVMRINMTVMCITMAVMCITITDDVSALRRCVIVVRVDAVWCVSMCGDLEVACVGMPVAQVWYVF